MPPLAVDTLHIPYQDGVYDAGLLAQVAFAHRYDVVLLHIILNNGARVADGFFEALTELALEPHGELWNPVTCIRKTTLHDRTWTAADSAEPMPCIIKLDQNYNRKETVHLCRTEADLDAWKRATPAEQQRLFVREPFHVDYKHRAGGVYRLERWQIAFDSLTVESRLCDDLFVKAATSFRFQARDMRRLEADWQLLSRFGWDWHGQSVDCVYDEDEEAWDARYRVMRQVTADFALHFGELDVIRTGRNEFKVIDVTNTAGVLIASRYCLRLTQARLVQRLRDVTAGA